MSKARQAAMSGDGDAAVSDGVVAADETQARVKKQKFRLQG